MTEFIDNLGYELFSIGIVVLVVLVLYAAVKRKMDRDHSDME